MTDITVNRGSRSRESRTRETRARERTRRQSGAKRTLMASIRRIPAYLRLLGGLLRDPRVSRVDKAIVAGAIAYVVMPIDIIPDFIPFLGQLDDVYVLIFALHRLVKRAGIDVVEDHWAGDPADLSLPNMQSVLGAAALFLPPAIRRRLRRTVW
ncbi:MAG: YkvA family protein [Gemmatimonadaceae bacterium]